jgi:hypothetical protein
MTEPTKPIQRAPTPDGIAASVRTARQRGMPPVDSWDPPDCGEIDIRIASDGRWYHEGGEIRRPELVRLFSTILRRDGDRFVLVTPVEKVGIVVEDAPFVAVDFDVTAEDGRPVLTFETNVGDHAIAGPEHAIRVERDAETGEPRPYVHVRGGLEALIDRKSFYRMVERGETRMHDGAEVFGVESGGVFFPLSDAGDLG